MHSIDVEPAPILLLEQTALRIADVAFVLEENCVKGHDVALSSEDLQPDEACPVAELLDLGAPYCAVRAELWVIGVGGRHDVIDFAKRIGAVARAHQGFGRGCSGPTVPGTAALFIFQAGIAGAGIVRGDFHRTHFVKSQ